jgi:hypothetical protein
MKELRQVEQSCSFLAQSSECLDNSCITNWRLVVFKLEYYSEKTVVPSLPTWLLQALGDDTVVQAKHLFGQMRQPHQQGFKAQPGQVQFSVTAPRRSQAMPVHPDPDIA